MTKHNDPQPLDAGALAAQQNDAAARAALVSQQFDDGKTYDRTRVVTEARFFMAQSAEAMLEAGKRLVLMKENEPHGVFQDIVQDELGLNVRTARAMMQAAVKYLSPALEGKRQALAALGKTKLLELMTETDDDLVDLADGGSVAGLKLDDIETMSSRELKAALREHRADAETSDKMRADQAKRIDTLTQEVERGKRRLHTAEPAELTAQLLREFSETLHGAEHSIRQALHQGIKALRDDSAEHGNGKDHEPAIAAALAQLQLALDNVRDEFGVATMVAGNGAPSWADKDD